MEGESADAGSELLHGPYQAPDIRIGQELCCEIRGRLKVRRFSKGPVVWPMGHPGGQNGGRHSYIVCGDLVRAIRSESSQAIQQEWGVSEAVVTRWREAFGIETNNQGTRELRSLRSAGCHPSERLKQQRQRILSRQDKRREQPSPAWPAAEEALLGTMPDTQVAQALGRTLSVVSSYRWVRGIPAYHGEGARTRVRQSGSVALSRESLSARRSALGLLQTQVALRAGISLARYRSYEKFVGRQVLPEIVTCLAQALCCGSEELIMPRP